MMFLLDDIFVLEVLFIPIHEYLLFKNILVCSVPISWAARAATFEQPIKSAPASE
jgi:hypothetical protein